MTREDIVMAHHQLVCCIDGLDAVVSVANNGEDVIGVATCIQATLKQASDVFEKLVRDSRYDAGLEALLVPVDAGGGA